MDEWNKAPDSNKLLVVDDNPHNRDMLSRRLARRGYAVEVAENGADALEKINQAQYDLVLLDQMIPGTSGLDLLRLLRATYSQSELPVIMVTAVDQSQSIVEALDEGANDYVVKPVDLPVVTACIESQLARSKADRQSRVSDPLTHLNNRSFFLDCLTEALTRQRGRASESLAVMLIDLDGFKLFNESFGHAVGDQILIETASRFQGELAEPGSPGGCAFGSPVLARMGGDEFAVLLHAVADAGCAETVAKGLLSSLARPFALPGSQIAISASMGIALAAGGSTTAPEFLDEAELAMSRAKEMGRNRWVVFDSAMRQRAQARMAIALDLRHAIEREQLAVFYQPKVHLPTRSVVGFEALMRWRHPEYGLLSPAEFIPIAEQTGLIAALGTWILRQACTQLKFWQTHFPSTPPLSMNVNLSVKQLADAQLVPNVESILAETGIPPDSLKLELTESALVSEIESVKDVLSRLRALHVGLKLDDFGTGYSSLSYLRTLHFDSLKIDRSFVNRLDADAETRAIVETILNLARNLHMTVVAEGIETEEQLAHLVDLGCDVGQGFLFSKPVAAEFAEQLLGSARAL
jgi:diguanylate cyclase (GGDEF)-like protein